MREQLQFLDNNEIFFFKNDNFMEDLYFKADMEHLGSATLEKHSSEIEDLARRCDMSKEMQVIIGKYTRPNTQETASLGI